MQINRIRLVIVLLSCLPWGHLAAQKSSDVNYTEKVNTLIGTKGKGHSIHESYLEAGYTFPGAMYPFGMVQFTPTFFAEEKGFVVNQLSGAGCEHLGNFPMLPLPGALRISPDSMLHLDPRYKIGKAVAGYYKVKVKEKVDCELTVTKRTGMARISCLPGEKKMTVIIGSGINSTKITDAQIRITSPGKCEGYANAGSFCGSPTSYKVYFVAEFDSRPVASGTWKGKALQPSSRLAEGENSGAYFTFDISRGKPVGYKFGISYVSLENARQNLTAENPGWSFDQVRQETASAWNKYLGKIEVNGGNADQVTQFYTHLYHSFGHPNIFNDVNGEYTGADHKVHKVEQGDYYTSFSNWDTYRTQVQLISMLAPKETSDMVSSLLAFAEQSGGGFARWIMGDTETGIMQGDPTSILVANAHAFGATGFDPRKALEIMRRGAEVPGTKSQDNLTRPHLEQYLEKGYMHASMMLEYTSADFAIGRFALQALNDSTLWRTYLKRAQLWKNLYNPSSGWLQSRHPDGSWKRYDEDWREASYKNYFWMVPYNLKGLISVSGGKAKAEQRLDEFFSKLNASYSQEWFAAGNEPDFQVPWVYNWTGAPYKAQETVRRILNEQYSNRANGLPGNDDLGAMGAWYVFADIGLFPMVPGVGGFSVSSPLFSSISIHLGTGKTLTIRGGDADKKYITSLKLNGTPLNGTWVPWSNIQNGGELTFTLSAVPDKSWGTATEPPSFDNEDWTLGNFIRPQGKNPVITPDSLAVFKDPMSGKQLAWEANDTFNPAAVVKDGKICVLYRAEDRSGKGIGQRTSRIGLAESTDGVTLTKLKNPVLFPAADNQKEFEWTGGCEDPRVAVTEDGTYLMLYTQWNHKTPRLAAATSKDLLHWKKHGPVFRKAYNGKFFNMATKSASVLTKVQNDRLVITKINGLYWMYWGEAAVYAATSADLVNWAPLLDDQGNLKVLMSPRKYHFDSMLTECGPPAVLTSKGIILIYNGKNLSGADGDRRYTPGSYCAGQALFSEKDPSEIKDRLDQPFFVPTEPFEKSGQYPAGTVFTEGLVFFKGRWFLYYGCADSRVAVAVSDR